MKKIALVLVLATVFTVGAFAERPGGWGIGGLYQGGTGVGDAFGNYTHGIGVSLKAPQLPIYWGINFDFRGGFNLGVTGDYLLLDQVLVSDINLGWYVAGGLYGRIGIDGDNFGFGVGARLPIGLYIMPLMSSGIPLEFFIDIAPSIGLGIDSDGLAPDGGPAFDVGIRFWL